jgi:uncharacterized protein (DUF1501 family)
MTSSSRIRSVPAVDTTHRAGRRVFLRQAGALSALAGTGAPLALGLMAAGESAAQTATDYRAIVCVFLFGGNDSFNMVLPTDSASFAAYSATRNQAPDSIALLAPGTAAVPGAMAGSPARLGGVLPITPIDAQGRAFALHPLMGRLVPLFNTDRRLAILPNIGPLVVPTTKAQFPLRNHPRPASLFSHNDQQNTWQALGPEGTTRGWGGRIGDRLAAGNTRAAFTTISASGNAVFLAGDTVRQYQLGTNGATRLAADASGNTFGSAAVTAALERIVSRSRGSHVLEADLAAVSQRAIDAEMQLRTTLTPAGQAPFGTPPASGGYNAGNDPLLRYTSPINGTVTANNLAQQLQVVARMIDAGMRGATGVRRQVFFVSMGGFDNHDLQNRNHSDLMARLAHALGYFDGVLGGLGAQGNVTTFTASDFGRTFTSNGDGTDHGWGSHHFVMGGAVRGGNLYGRFPTLATKNAGNNNFDGSPDQLGNGSLLPTTSVDQLGATLARWMGLSAADALEIFPNLANWDSSARDLGFLTA